MLKKWLSRSYIYIVLILFYIPLFIGAIYSFSRGSSKGNMSLDFSMSGEGWGDLLSNENVAVGIANSLIIGLTVALIVVSLGLLTVFGLWRQKNRTAKGFVTGTSNVPLINPDIITAIMLALAFGGMFGDLTLHDKGAERIIIGHVVMIFPFALAMMSPRSDKFNKSLFEASKDLGYGPVRTWFKTYFVYMLPVVAASFIIAMALSFDDFIISRVVSKETTVGKLMYQGSLKPWILAMGTIVMALTLGTTMIVGIYLSLKGRKKVKYE